MKVRHSETAAVWSGREAEGAGRHLADGRLLHQRDGQLWARPLHASVGKPVAR